MNFTTDKGTWFYFDESDHSKGGICIRALTNKESLEISKRTTKNVTKYNRGSRNTIEETDLDLQLSLTWDKTIVDWINVSLDGEELNCNRENKIKLMKNYNSFSNFYSNKLDEVVEQTELDLEAKEKN